MALWTKGLLECLERNGGAPDYSGQIGSLKRKRRECSRFANEVTNVHKKEGEKMGEREEIRVDLFWKQKWKYMKILPCKPMFY